MEPPRSVSKLVADLRYACKTEPAVEWIPSRAHWRVSVSNERVVMTLDMKMTSGRRWVWASSTLTIDGVRGPLTSGFEHFVRVWKNPEEMVNKSPVPPPISSPIEVVPLESMPSEIATAIRLAAKRNSDVDASVIGYVDENFWAAELSLGRSVIRIHWRRPGNDPMPTDHVYLMIDGEDKSELAEGQLSKALALAAQVPHPGVAGSASIDGAAGSQRDRGIEVRTTHVMRT